MRRILLGFVFSATLFVGNIPQAEAQSVNIHVNINNQPAWGPVGYDYASYYYFPDIDIYYDVNRRLFYYPERRAWRSAQYLPYRYNRYDLYGMYKVVINQPDPWRYHDRYRQQYAHFRGYRSQPVILNSADRRYASGRNNRIAWINPERTGKPNDFITNNRVSSDRPRTNDNNHYQTSRTSSRVPNDRQNKSSRTSQSPSGRYSNRNQSKPTFDMNKTREQSSNRRSETKRSASSSGRTSGTDYNKERF